MSFGGGDANAPMQHRKSTAIVGYALLGSYLKGVEYIYKRYVTVDLTPANFFSVSIRMVLAAFVALVFGHFIDFTDRNLPLVMAFVVGFFPERWLKYLVVLVNKKIKIKGEVILPSHTLEAIDGLNDTHRIRLQEVGIDNVQNLKGYNFLELMVKTPFPVRTLLDWKMQAQLICKFHDDYLKLRKIGVRTSFDFIQAIETTSLENAAKDLSNLTTIEELLLCINYENLKKDPSVIMLSEFKTHIYTKSSPSE